MSVTNRPNLSLDMLLTYSSDMSDEELEEHGNEHRTSMKRRCSDDEEDYTRKSNTSLRLPVPNIQISNEVPGEHHLDDPSLHKGKVRSFPHERGNWVSFVYVPCQLDLPEDILAKLKRICLEFSIETEFNLCEPHISLTKTLVLRHHWIELFVKSVKEHLEHFKCFMVVFGELKVYCNEDKTRTFLAFEIRSGYDTLLSMVQTLEDCLAEFNLPKFYEDPSFHVSVAWCNGDYKDLLTQILPHLEQCLYASSEESQKLTYVTYVESSVGNILRRYNLKSK